MMPEPPGCGVYLSARERRTRSAAGEYPRLAASFKSEIGGGYRLRRGEVKGVGISADESKAFDARTFC